MDLSVGKIIVAPSLFLLIAILAFDLKLSEFDPQIFKQRLREECDGRSFEGRLLQLSAVARQNPFPSRISAHRQKGDQTVEKGKEVRQ